MHKYAEGSVFAILRYLVGMDFHCNSPLKVIGLSKWLLIVE